MATKCLGLIASPALSTILHTKTNYIHRISRYLSVLLIEHHIKVGVVATNGCGQPCPYIDFGKVGTYVSKVVPPLQGHPTCTSWRDLGNPQDPFAVVMMTASSVNVGHVARKISSVCSIFLRTWTIYY